MSVPLKKMMSIAAALAMLLVLSIGSESYAQRDAGAKARGEIGRSFWGQGSGQSSTRRSFSYQGQVQTRRSFSYQPAPAATGNCPPVAESKAVEQESTDAQPAEAPPAVRRSYSYEPSMQSQPRRAYSRRSAAPQRSTSPLLEGKDVRNNPR
jgi:hypothetical protein